MREIRLNLAEKMNELRCQNVSSPLDGASAAAADSDSPFPDAAAAVEADVGEVEPSASVGACGRVFATEPSVSANNRRTSSSTIWVSGLTFSVTSKQNT